MILFYIKCKDLNERSALIAYLKENIEIVKNSKSNKELCTGVYFFNYYEKDCILDYVE